MRGADFLSAKTQGMVATKIGTRKKIWGKKILRGIPYKISRNQQEIIAPSRRIFRVLRKIKKR
jgi:hypothetical protein